MWCFGVADWCCWRCCRWWARLISRGMPSRPSYPGWAFRKVGIIISDCIGGSRLKHICSNVTHGLLNLFHYGECAIDILFRWSYSYLWWDWLVYNTVCGVMEPPISVMLGSMSTYTNGISFIHIQKYFNIYHISQVVISSRPIYPHCSFRIYYNNLLGNDFKCL